MTARVHFAGPLSWKLADGSTTTVSGTYPSCCTGIAAGKVLDAGNHTTDVLAVTCSRCRHNLHRAGVELARGPVRRDGADAEADRILDELEARCGTGNRVLAQQFLAAELRKIAQGPRKWGVLR